MSSQKRKADDAQAAAIALAMQASAKEEEKEQGTGTPLLYINDLTSKFPARAEDLHLVVKVFENENRKVMYKSGKGSLFSVVLLDRDNDIVDAKNKIKLTVFSSNKNYDHWFELLQTGSVVRIWLGKLKVVNDTKFNDTGHKFELNLSDASAIDLLSEQIVRDNYWTFGGKVARSISDVTCPISELIKRIPSVEEEKAVPAVLVSILGVVIHFTEMNSGHTKYGGTWQHSKVILASSEMVAVEITFWDRFAELDFEVGKVVYAENLKLSSYNTCTLSSTKSSHVEFVNDDNMSATLVPSLHEEVKELASWLDEDRCVLSKNTRDFTIFSKWDRNSAANKAKIVAESDKSHIGDLNRRAASVKAFIDEEMQSSDTATLDVSLYQEESDAHNNNGQDDSRFKKVVVPSDIAKRVETGKYNVRATVARIKAIPKHSILVPCCSNDIPITNTRIDSIQTNATKKCGKWVKAVPKGWQCDSCQDTRSTCDYTYRVPVEIVDEYGSCVIDIYHEAVKCMLGNVDALTMLTEEARDADGSSTLESDTHLLVNQLLIDRVSRTIQDKEFGFVLKSHPDGIKGLKYTCDIASHVDYEKESAAAIESAA